MLLLLEGFGASFTLFNNVAFSLTLTSKQVVVVIAIGAETVPFSFTTFSVMVKVPKVLMVKPGVKAVLLEITTPGEAVQFNEQKLGLTVLLAEKFKGCVLLVLLPMQATAGILIITTDELVPVTAARAASVKLALLKAIEPALGR